MRRLRNQYKTYALSTNVDPSSRKHLVHSQLCDKIAPTWKTTASPMQPRGTDEGYHRCAWQAKSTNGRHLVFHWKSISFTSRRNHEAQPWASIGRRGDASSIWHQVWVRHLWSSTNPHCGLFLLSNQARGRKNHVAEVSEAEQQWPSNFVQFH